MDTFTIRRGGVSGGFKQMLHNITDHHFSKVALKEVVPVVILADIKRYMKLSSISGSKAPFILSLIIPQALSGLFILAYGLLDVRALNTSITRDNLP
jgi:hypothetical protein